MPRGRPLKELTLTAEERTRLTRWTRRPKTAQALALRARLVLAAAEGRSNRDVAAALLITEPTVGKWRRRFLAGRLDGLLDEPRPGAPRTIGDADVERVIALTLESAPRDATHWSTRSMAGATGFSQSSISRIWRAFALAPHRTETFKLEHRSAVHREGPRHRRAVPRASGPGRSSATPTTTRATGRRRSSPRSTSPRER